MLCTNLAVKQLYTDVQLLNSLFQKAYGKFFQNRRVNTSDRIDKNRRIIVANG